MTMKMDTEEFVKGALPATVDSSLHGLDSEASRWLLNNGIRPDGLFLGTPGKGWTYSAIDGKPIKGIG